MLEDKLLGRGLCALGPARLCCEAMVWAVSFLAFPLRMLSTVERERKLGGLIAEMQAQMDDLVWENKDLEDRLRAALKEQDAMEAVLDEMEEEHEDAFARIDRAGSTQHSNDPAQSDEFLSAGSE